MEELQVRKTLRERWPRLAWVARCGEHVDVDHGPGVEFGAGWVFEGAWTGPYLHGGFDEAAVCCGSGVRIRNGEAVFVAPTSTIDRLVWLRTGPRSALVSNSILALTATVGARVVDPKYRARVRSITRGIGRCAKSIETSAGPLHLHYFHNLVWDGAEMSVREKPMIGETIGDFATYRRFLSSSMKAVAGNASHSGRALRLSLLGTVSSGYDANAATALAAEAGCRTALSFTTTGRGQPDDGAPIAEALGVSPVRLKRGSWRESPTLSWQPEAPILAAGQGSGLIEFHAAHRELRGTLLVSGFYGDSIWNPAWSHSGPDVVRKDASGGGFSEYRLHAGFVNCAPAFWAAREVRDVVSLAGSPEMRPWSGPGEYERPIPRRILGEAGVSADAFGQRKRAVPKAQPHRDPAFLMPESRADYFRWLAERGEVRSPGSAAARDRIGFELRRGSLRLHRLLGALPGMRSHRWWVRRRERLTSLNRKPTHLRRHVVEWALDRGRDLFD